MIKTDYISQRIKKKPNFNIHADKKPPTCYIQLPWNNNNSRWKMYTEIKLTINKKCKGKSVP